jgi:hypothetical protein
MHRCLPQVNRRTLTTTVSQMTRGLRREWLPQVVGLGDAGLDAFADAYLRELHARAPGCDRNDDKMPGNFMHGFFASHPYAHDQRDLGWYIGQYDRLMTHWKSVPPNPIQSFALTDWIEDFDGTWSRILGFLALPHDTACIRFTNRTAGCGPSADDRSAIRSTTKVSADGEFMRPGSSL